MKKEKDNHIDRLFREGLSEPEGRQEYREDDWDAMEKLLAKEPRERTAMVWLYRVSGSIAAILLIFFGLQWLKSNEVPKKRSMAKVTHQRKAAAGRFHEEETPLNKNRPDYLTVKPGLNQPDYAQNTAALRVPLVTRNKVAPAEKTNQRSKEFEMLPPDSATTSKTASVDLQTLGLMRLAQRTVIHPFTADSLLLASNLKSSAYSVASSEKGDWLSHPNAFTEQAAQPKLPLSVAFITAPDLNKAGSGAPNKVGGSAGLQLSVRIVGKLSVVTGAAYGIKNYDIGTNQEGMLLKYSAAQPGRRLAAAHANPANLNVSATIGSTAAASKVLTVIRPTVFAGSTGTTASQLTGVSANCRVLDIPLNLSYQMIGSDKTNLSIGSGLSSYFMISEHYSYNYADNSVYNVNLYNQDRHILGVLNLNTTYQQQLSSALKLVVQPYLKLPLTQIGYEHVNLQTTGLAVGVSWNVRTSKPK